MPTCDTCGTNFTVTAEDERIITATSPVIAGKTIAIPAPTSCPDCRKQRRLMFRNERRLYLRKCDATGKQVISLYHPDSPYTVYDQDVWWSDRFDPLSYGRPFDFGKPFFDQYQELSLAVPRLAIQNAKSENSAYTNYSAENRNCYLVVGGLGSEDSYYGYRIFYSKDTVDCYDLYKCELCYEVNESKNLYNCTVCNHCFNSSDLTLCSHCTGCDHCFGCVNLRNKRHYIFNEDVGEGEYEAKVKVLREKWASTVQRFEELRQKSPYNAVDILQCEECRGDALQECRNCFEAYVLKGSEDCRYVSFGEKNRSCMDANFFDNCELQYFSANLEKNYRVAFANLAWYDSDSFYVTACFNSKHLFGCIGMKKHQHCILNKQYTQEEYDQLVPRIIEHMRKTGEWGQYFSPPLSPFAYNETVAQESFPLSEEQVRSKGWRWQDITDEIPKVEKIIPAMKLPASIDDIPDDILNWAIQSEESQRPFRIIKQELDFYRKMRLPIPHLHPDERHRRRMALTNPHKLWKRACAKCGNEILTTFASDRPEIVYCEQCYFQAVY